MRIEQLQDEFPLDCHYRLFPLHPDTPDEGMSLAEMFGGQMDISAAMAQLAEKAQSLGLPFGARSETYNSRKAQELGLWVEQQGRFKEYQAAVYHAYFADGINIATTDALLSIISALQMDPTKARQVIEHGEFSAAVDQQWQQALKSGIRAVPSLRCEGRELVGFQSLATTRAFILG